MPIGKKIGDDLYAHLACLDEPEFASQRLRVESALHAVSGSAITPNVFKINLKTDRLSLLSYTDFDASPFPALLASWTFAQGCSDAPTFRTYSSSLNPPILHRKELLVHPSHPERQRWEQCTQSAEELGLFSDPITIGFRLNWQRLIEQKGYHLVNGAFHPIGNADGDGNDDEQAEQAALAGVQRHLTALSRNGISAPVQILLRHQLLLPGHSFFDYGCGRGSDVAALKDLGVAARGWDPYYAKDHPLCEAEVVNLGFVVNVIEDPAERVEAIRNAFNLAQRVMSIGVMIYGPESPGKPYMDGFLTSRNTFQKYFSQPEFKDYLEHVLHEEVFMVGPGLALVFKDKVSQQRFSVDRYRSKGVSARLLSANSPRLVRDPLELAERRLAKRQTLKEQKYAAAQPLLDALWRVCLDLGRYPEADEVAALPPLKEAFGSLGAALRQISDRYDLDLLRQAQATRRDDLLLFFAMQQFAHRPAFRSLEDRLQRDIKAFFGDYAQAQQQGMKLLMDAADKTAIRNACNWASENGLGYLNGQQSLLLHLSLVERLPVSLRAYVACGLIVYGAVSEVQLVKIHIDSGKLTLLQYDDFDSNALPLLAKRIKVNIGKQDFDIFEYSDPKYPKQMLAWKSRYINEDTPGFAEQQALDETLELQGILPNPEHGHFSESLIRDLEARRLMVDGLRLAESHCIPDLDSRCGQHFSYRQFIECGETQQHSRLPNLPVQAATYNALYALATQLLDPITEYFGSIRLTYGFCSPQLSKLIHARVAPKLDQHAAHELDKKGIPICSRLGAACDFIVDDENMREVADWIIANLPFDRLYFYGDDRPLHLSICPQNARAAYTMQKSTSGAVVPRPYSKNRQQSN